MRIWQVISNAGIRDTDSSDVTRRFKLINRFCFLAAATTFFFAPLLYFVGNHYYALIQVIAGTVTSLYFLFSLRRLYSAAFVWMFFCILLNVFYASLEVKGAGVEYYLIPLGFGTFLVFKDRRISISMMVLCAVTFFVSYFWMKTYQPHHLILSPWIEIFYTMILISNFFLCAVFISQFTMVNQRYEKTISEQKLHLAEKNKDITDSLNYAKRIQTAKLPKQEEIESAFPDSFVLFRPKDIVSGDFYFFHRDKNHACIAAADCTGHGVPGAFMSMIGSEKLGDALQTGVATPEILNYLNKGIKSSLRQSDSDDSTRDGMDIAFCSVDLNSLTVNYTGAQRPIWILRKNQNEIEEIKATKKSLGGRTEDNQRFDLHTIQLQRGDSFYLFSDGYADSFNGENGKKLTTKRFRELLLSVKDQPMRDQKSFLENFISEWSGVTEQVDDILVIGIRL
jgi:serine phosphatase RsbU (regulator of sigma subunit)